MRCFVYILYSESIDCFYKGQTADICDRLIRHNKGYEKSTKRGIPWKLVWYTEEPDRSEATLLERKLKNLSRSKTIDFIRKNKDGVAGPDVTPEA